jgi:hypothetical protein
MARRFYFYIPWSRPAETQASIPLLNNRFPTVSEARRCLWRYDKNLVDPFQSLPDTIDSLLEVFILGRLRKCTAFIDGLGGSTNIVERQQGLSWTRQTLDTLPQDAIDTLVVLSFDHFTTLQAPSAAEVDWVRQFLRDPRKCLAVCPHHDVGASNVFETQLAEFLHHDDPSVPAQDGVGGYARALLRDLGYSIQNRFGLRALTGKDGEPAPLEVDYGRDAKGILKGVTTFTAHFHLPHLEVPASIESRVRVLARQPVVTPSPGHPFLAAGGNDKLNAMLQIDGFEGTLVVSDVTLWLGAAEKGEESLKTFWTNMANI